MDHQRDNGIDALKFICAMLVIIIHCETPYKYYLLPLTRVAVPCFFIISGYYMYGRISVPSHFKKSICRFLKIFLWSSILYLPFWIGRFVKHHAVPTLDSIDWADFLICNVHPFAPHLWYIPAYIYVLVLAYLLIRFCRHGWYYFTVPFLLAANVLLANYSTLLWDTSMPDFYSRNFLFTGLPFFLIGMFIQKNKPVFLNMQFPFGAGILLFTALTLLEANAIQTHGWGDFGDLYFSTIFLSIFLFIYFLKKEIPASRISYLGRNYALEIYIFQLAPVIVFTNLAALFPMIEPFYSWTAPLCVLIVTLVISYLFKKIFQSKKLF